VALIAAAKANGPFAGQAIRRAEVTSAGRWEARWSTLLR
jgi:hypothetical protein